MKRQHNHVHRRLSLYTMADLAAALGIPYQTVWASVTRQSGIPAPTVPLGQRLYYTAEDVQAIKEKFDTTK